MSNIHTYTAQLKRNKKDKEKVTVQYSIDFDGMDAEQIKTLACKFIVARTTNDWQRAEFPSAMKVNAKDFLVRRTRITDAASALKTLTMEQLLAFCKARGLDISPNASAG